MTKAALSAMIRPLVEPRLPEWVEPLWFASIDELYELAPEAEIGNHVDHRIGDLEAFLCRIVPGQPPGQNGGRDRNVRGRRCR